jgi:hypothetical protein
LSSSWRAVSPDAAFEEDVVRQDEDVLEEVEL